MLLFTYWMSRVLKTTTRRQRSSCRERSVFRPLTNSLSSVRSARIIFSFVVLSSENVEDGMDVLFSSPEDRSPSRVLPPSSSKIPSINEATGTRRSIFGPIFDGRRLKMGDSSSFARRSLTVHPGHDLKFTLCKTKKRSERPSTARTS